MGSQSGICKQLVLSMNPSSATSQALVSASHWASEPCIPCCLAQKAIQGRARWRRGCPRTWVCRGDVLAWHQKLGPQGPCSEEQRHKSITEPLFPPHLLPLPGSGWGTPIVLLSGGEQTKKRLPGAAGRLAEPFLCLPEHRLVAASAWPFFALLPRGDAGVQPGVWLL